jgi:iron complex outermembrane receptor protein
MISVAAPALAQSTTAAEVVVTGSVRAQRLLDAPFAITAIDAAALRDAGPMVNLSEVMSRVPGIVVNNRNNYAQDLQISSRGFGARAAFGVRGLRLYADGIPATMPDGQGQVAHFDLANAQRIEVLRGPFSVLFGNSSGGVIAMFTAPVRSGASEVELDAGSFGLRQARVNLATPLGESFEMRGSFSNVELEGFRAQSAAHRTLGNLSWAYRSAADTVTVSVLDNDLQAQDPLGLTQADFDADTRRTDVNAAKYDTRKQARQSQAGVSWRHRFAGEQSVLQESTVTAYYGSRGVTQWQAIPPTTQAAAKHGGGVVDYDRAYGGIEGKLGFRLGDAAVVAGLNAETQQDDRRGYENFLGPSANPTALGVTGKQRRNETNRATSTDAYLQANLPLAADWDLTGGLRGGKVHMSTHDRYVVGTNGDDSGQLDYTYFNPVLGMHWSLSKAWSLHASAARGFESPSLGELAYRADGAGGFNTDLQGQTSRQFEIGSKWRGTSTQLDVALFNAQTANEIGVQTNSGGRSAYQNVGRTRRQGLEASAQWQVQPGLRLQAAVTYLQAHYLDGFLTCTATPCAKATVPVAAGNHISGTQSTSGFAEVAWKAPGLPGEWALEWRGMARTWANDVNTASAAGYALAHLRWSGSLPLGASDVLQLLARIDNVFDRRYAGSVIVNDANGRFFEPGSPRSALVSARWQHKW